MGIKVRVQMILTEPTEPNGTKTEPSKQLEPQGFEVKII